MKTESSYIFEEPSEQGLGRMPIQSVLIAPAIDEPIHRNQTEPIRQPSIPRHLPPPKPAVRQRPVIDKNPVPAPPKLIINTVKESTNHAFKATTKPATQNKPTSNQQPLVSSEILEGTFTVAGVNIKKTHVAMAGGGLIGSLLLWKLLF